MSRPFEPIERTTVTARIREELLNRIVTGELAPGSVLPSERALTEQFAVARTSVREAIQGLMSVGVVERRSNRAHVTEHLPQILLHSGDGRKDMVRELFETRRVLELPIFELAACRADDRQRRAILDLAKGFTPDMDLAAFRVLDRQFHTTVAAACGNPLLMELYGKVLDALFRSEAFESLLFDTVNEASVAEIINRSGADHRAIAEAVVDGDPVRVLEAAESHLRNVEDHMVDDLV